MEKRGEPQMFVAHRVAGVHLIPAAWLDARRSSGFREATPCEIACWYDERDMELPTEILRLANCTASAQFIDPTHLEPTWRTR